MFFPPHGSGDDLLKSISPSGRNVGQVGTVEANRLLGQTIVVSVEKRRGVLSQAQRVHTEHTQISLRRRSKAGIAHHAHDRQGRRRRFSSMEVQHCTALMPLRLSHPVIDYSAELCHLDQRCFGHAAAVDVFLDPQPVCPEQHRRVFHRSMRPSTSERSRVSMEMPCDSKNLLAVADSVKGGGTRANRSHTQVAKAIDYPANAGKPCRSLANSGESGLSVCSVVIEYGMPYCRKLVARRHLAAETVPSEGDGHLLGIVGRRLNQHWDVQVRQPQGIRNSALFAEVRQSHESTPSCGRDCV